MLFSHFKQNKRDDEWQKYIRFKAVICRNSDAIGK